MTAPLGASTCSSLFGARTRSSSRGTSALFLLHPYPATLRGSACQRVLKGAAGTAGPPPPRWAMSNQLRGQGALWTERDKRPLCALRVTDLPSPSPPRRADAQVPSAGRGQLPEPRRRSPPGGWERGLGLHRVPAHLEPLDGPAPGTKFRLTWVLRGPGPSSRQPLPPRPGRPKTPLWSCSAPGQRDRKAPATAACNAPPTSGFTYFGPRPSWTSSILTAA